MKANLGEAPSVANFGERWPLACFALPSRYFGLLGGGEIRSGAEGSQFDEGRHLLPIPGEGGLQPIVYCQPNRSGEGHFWLYRQSCCWLCRQVCFVTVLSGISLVRSGPSYHGCVIKG